MPVEDHPVHPKTSFKEVPLSPCHSSLPVQTRAGYWVMNLHWREDGTPYHQIEYIKDWHDGRCKQVTNELPECRGCTNDKRSRHGIGDAGF